MAGRSVQCVEGTAASRVTLGKYHSLSESPPFSSSSLNTHQNLHIDMRPSDWRRQQGNVTDDSASAEHLSANKWSGAVVHFRFINIYIYRKTHRQKDLCKGIWQGVRKRERIRGTGGKQAGAIDATLRRAARRND